MKRPLMITIWAAFLTIAGVIGIASAAWIYWSGQDREYGLYEGIYAFYAPFSHVFGAVVFVGIWLMRKWAFVGYIAGQISGAAVFWISNPEWSSAMPLGAWGSLAAAALFAATTLPYWGRMTWHPLPIRDASLDTPQNANS